jgi:CheY-like chemotaxis protein
MARVLVVDDSPTDRLLVTGLLEKREDLECESVVDAASALERLEESPPDLVVTDLVMPGMNGLELVAEIRERFTAIPVVLMTSQGNEEIAVRALKEGASSYVPKRNLATDLGETVSEILELASARREQDRLRETMQRCEARFSIESRHELVRPLVKHLQGVVGMMYPWDEAELTQVGVALCEALNNAIEHGNLEISAELRDRDIQAHAALTRERQETPPYRDRRVLVLVRLEGTSARFVVRDEGPGFDPDALPDPLDPRQPGKGHRARDRPHPGVHGRRDLQRPRQRDHDGEDSLLILRSASSSDASTAKRSRMPRASRTLPRIGEGRIRLVRPP